MAFGKGSDHIEGGDAKVIELARSLELFFEVSEEEAFRPALSF